MPRRFEKAGILTSKLHMKLENYNSLKAQTRLAIIEAIEHSKSIPYEGLEIIASVDSKEDIRFANVAKK